MKKYLVLVGEHRERGEVFNRGDILVSPFDLVALFINSFRDLGNATDQEIAAAGLSEDSSSAGDLVFSNFISTLGYLDIEGNSDITSITIKDTTEVHYGMYFSDLPGLTDFVADSLVSVNNSIFIDPGCSGLINLSFENLTTVGQTLSFRELGTRELHLPKLVSTGNFQVKDFPLDVIDLPLWHPVNNTNVAFTNCGLSEANVDLMLAKAVANAEYVTGILDLSGVSNSAPSAQGLLDKATLAGRVPGVQVTTN